MRAQDLSKPHEAASPIHALRANVSRYLTVAPLLVFAATALLGLSGCQVSTQSEPSPAQYRHNKTYTFGKYKIEVVSWPQKDSASLEYCQIKITGENNESFILRMDMDIAEASWVTDLDRDGNFEVLILGRSAGSGSFGEIRIFEWDRKELVARPLPELTARQAVGYFGHDKFQVPMNQIVREFPVYKSGDPNSTPTGGTRRLTYWFADKKWKVTEE